MRITVNTKGQVAALREIDRWTEYINKELQKVARDTESYMTCIANGTYGFCSPNTTKVQEYVAKRDALLELISALDIKDEWLEMALKGNRAYYVVAE